MILKSKKITLRPPTKADIPALASIANNKKIFDNVRDLFPHPYTLKDAENFIEFIHSKKSREIFAIEFEGQLAGFGGVHLQEDVYRKTGEIGYWLGEDFWGKGIATETVKLLVKYGFEELELIRIFAGVFEHNLGSMRVLEKAGFEKEGILRKAVIKNGEILDEHRYAILK